MTQKDYAKLTDWFRMHPKTASAVCLANSICTRLIYICYPAMLVSMMFQHDPKLIRTIMVPAVSFVLLSIIRGKINSPRPYEKYEIAPLIKKETKGNSFPSRHVFSAFVISMAGYYSNPLMGSLFLIMGVIVAICRVLGGVHFCKDVCVGAMVGIFCGIIGFVIF